MVVVAREPRANAAFLRLPRSGNHHDLGLFGVGAQPPRRARIAIGLYHLAWQVDTIDELEEARLTLAELDALTGESSHGATKSVYAPGPRRQRVRGDVDAAPGRTGASTRTPPPSNALDLPGEVARWGGTRTAAELVPLDAVWPDPPAQARARSRSIPSSDAEANDAWAPGRVTAWAPARTATRIAEGRS